VTNDLISGYPIARTQSVQEVAVLLHPRVVKKGQRLPIEAIFTNAPTGFVDVAFSCSDGQFVGSDGSPSTTFTTSASGATLRGFTFWRRAEAVWIAPDSPGRVTLQATLSIPNVYEYTPKDVRPAGAGFSQDETRGWVLITADNSIGQPLSIYVTVEPVPYSGGHQHHSSGRSAGTCTPWEGILVGAYSTTYIAPEVCREAKIKVIPSASFPFNPQPPQPHDTAEVFVPGLQMNYNDISLQWGGLFDINADWRPPHYEHRRGRQVDFSNADNLPADLQRALRGIIGQYGGEVRNEGNHWHVRF